MPSPELTALLRAVLDDVCKDISRQAIGAGTHVAANLLEAANNGETSFDALRQVGRQALNSAPTMWR